VKKDAMEMIAVPVNADPKEKKSDKGDKGDKKGALGNADSRRKGR
jgi:hypothetical protein